VIPDGIEPVIGWRSWTLRDPELIASIAKDVPWPPRCAVPARCLAHDHGIISYMTTTKRVAPHSEGPERGCTCGYWALKEMPEPGNPVVGTVKLWGGIVEGEHGYRGQYAYPDHLYLIDDGRWRKEPLWHREGRARLLGEAYGVECTLITVRDYHALRALDQQGRSSSKPADQAMIEEVAAMKNEPADQIGEPPSFDPHQHLLREWATLPRKRRLSGYLCFGAIILNLASAGLYLALCATH
jgi:hypothetical protein